jgi:hypothetical protein
MTENNEFVFEISCDGIKRGILLAERFTEIFGYSLLLLV